MLFSNLKYKGRNQQRNRNVFIFTPSLWGFVTPVHLPKLTRIVISNLTTNVHKIMFLLWVLRMKFLTQALLINLVEFSLSIIRWSLLHKLCNNNLGQKGFCSTKVPDTSLQAWSRKDKARIGQLITLYIRSDTMKPK